MEAKDDGEIVLENTRSLNLNQENLPKTTYLDEYGIERCLSREKIATSTGAFRDMIQNPDFKPFFNISESELRQTESVILYLNNQVGNPSDDDFSVYIKYWDIFCNLPANPPFFVIDNNNNNTFTFCITPRRGETAIKIDEKYYLLNEIDTLDLKQVTTRIHKVNKIEYFPELKIKKLDDKNYIAHEFIPNIKKIGKNYDISAFINECKKIDFGADTNYSNFIKKDDKLYYVDQDLIDWVKDPEKYSFYNGIQKNITRTETW